MPRKKTGPDKPAKDILIYLDMDGVFSDFDTHAREEGKLKPDGRLDYDALDFKWWKTMPVYDGAKQFYNDLKDIGGEMNFLTGPMPHPQCFGGKAMWISNFLSKWQLGKLNVCPSKKKKLLAGPRRVLIDDRENNVREWREAGGIGVHHDGDYAKTLEKVNEAVTAYLMEDAAPPPPKTTDEPMIFVNANGVLADFMGHARAEGKLKPDGKVDYDGLDMKWWVNMPNFDGAKDFFYKLKDLADTNVLSAPTMRPAGFGGKAVWMAELLSTYDLMKLIVCPTKKKTHIAGPNRILIDDDEASVKAWEKAGGIGIHHTGDFEETYARAAKHIAAMTPATPEPKRPATKPKGLGK